MIKINRYNELIQFIKGNETEEKFLTNKDNLMQYTYKFKLNDDGFYYYQGFERTKE